MNLDIVRRAACYDHRLLSSVIVILFKENCLFLQEFRLKNGSTMSLVSDINNFHNYFESSSSKTLLIT